MIDPCYLESRKTRFFSCDRNHDYRDDIHHRPGNRNGERDDDHYRRQQFRPSLDHGGLGPRSGNTQEKNESCVTQDYTVYLAKAKFILARIGQFEINTVYCV